MDCKNHNNRHAIATCVVCQRGICYGCDCSVRNVSNFEEPLCPQCYNDYLKKLLTDYKEAASSKKGALIGTIILYIIGIVMMVNSMTILGIIFTGLPCLVYGTTWANNKTKKHIEVYGYNYNAHDDGNGNVTVEPQIPSGYYILILILAVFGVLTTLVIMILIFSDYSKNLHAAQKMESLILSDEEMKETIQSL